jgi:hypothetical protein
MDAFAAIAGDWGCELYGEVGATVTRHGSIKAHDWSAGSITRSIELILVGQKHLLKTFAQEKTNRTKSSPETGSINPRELTARF